MSFDYSCNIDNQVANNHLPPTRIKRKYKCANCEHTTINPRLHLRHRIQVHGQKLKIVECPLCVYACQYRQKLNRHLKLVHHYLSPNQANKERTSDNDYCYQNYPFQQLPLASMDGGASMVYNDEQPLDLSYPPEIKQLIQYFGMGKEQMAYK